MGKVFLLGLAAAVGTVPVSAQPSSGAAIFAQRCAMCHSMAPSERRLGPSLAGVVGRRAGSLPGFRFSPALANSAIIWNAAKLDMWLAGPQAMVPGNRMSYAEPDPAKRAAVVAYLSRSGAN